MLRWIKLGTLAVLLAAGVAVGSAAAQGARGGFTVEQIRVEGAQRIEAETVRS